MDGLKNVFCVYSVRKRRGRLPRIVVVDLFCGIGGLSYGMKQKGLEILAGFDVDDTCYSYKRR